MIDAPSTQCGGPRRPISLVVFHHRMHDLWMEKADVQHGEPRELHDFAFRGGVQSGHAREGRRGLMCRRSVAGGEDGNASAVVGDSQN